TPHPARLSTSSHIRSRTRAWMAPSRRGRHHAAQPTDPSPTCTNVTPTSEIHTLSLHDALPISAWSGSTSTSSTGPTTGPGRRSRSEEHTSELQSLAYLVWRLLLERKE